MKRQIAMLLVGLLLGGGLMAALPVSAADPSLKERVKTLEKRTINVRSDRFHCFGRALLVITDTSIVCEMPKVQL